MLLEAEVEQNVFLLEAEVQGIKKLSSVPSEEMEIILAHADTCFVTREAWEEKAVVGCQEGRSNTESWPSGSTE